LLRHQGAAGREDLGTLAEVVEIRQQEADVVDADHPDLAAEVVVADLGEDPIDVDPEAARLRVGQAAGLGLGQDESRRAPGRLRPCWIASASALQPKKPKSARSLA